MKKLIFGLLLTGAFTPLFAQEMQLIVPLGHTRRITDLDLSANQNWLATADGSPVVKLWDFSSRKEIYHLQHAQNVQTVIYAGKTLITGSAEGKLTSWDEEGKKLLEASLGNSTINELIYRNDTLLVGQPGAVSLVSVKDLKTFKSFAPIEKMTAWSWKGDQLYAGNETGQIATLDLKTGKTNTQNSAASAINSIAFIAQDEILIGNNAGDLIKAKLSGAQPQVEKLFAERTYHLQVQKSSNRIFAVGRDGSENFKVLDGNDLKSLKSSVEIKGDRDSEAFKFGLRAMTLAADTLLLVADHEQRIQLFNLKSDKNIGTFQGKAAAVYDLSLDRTGKWLAVATGHEEIKVLDLSGINPERILSGSSAGSRAVDFHPVNPVLAVYSLDEKIQVINTLNDEKIFELKAKGEYSTTPVNFDPSGKYILRKSSESDFDLYNFKTKAPKNLKVKDGKKYVFSANGDHLIFSTPDGLSIYSAINHNKIQDVAVADIQDLAMSETGDLAVLLKDDKTVKIFNSKYQLTKTVTLEPAVASDKISWTSDSKQLVGIKNSVARGATPDFTIKIIDAQTGKKAGILPGHAGFVTDVEFANGYLLTAAIDGKVNIWDLKKYEVKGTVIPLADKQWVVTTPKGLFDATTSAMDDLHYVKDGKVIALEQMKSSYYEPKLLSKILDLNTEPVRQAADLSDVTLFPEMKLTHPLKNDGKLGIELQSNGGGIGRVVILINGKEVSSDVRSAATVEKDLMEINYDLSSHPFLYNDKVSTVTIMAYNESGTLSTEPKNVYVFGQQKKLVKPRLFAIVAGSSDYKGDDLDLKYAAKDAADLANAVKISATSYLGAENVFMTMLTTDQPKTEWPTKENIKKAFDQYATQASANDLLLVYLSGHGANKQGDFSDFYYMTCSADNGDLNNTVLRETASISSAEFTQYINSVPALKQILIIDACHSGRMASSLGSSRSAMSSTQIRALEKMKDRTGMYVLAGSAADAVSYETTLYGQGLLTYSLLFGLKGAALREDGLLDVMDWFEFAQGKVPQLAEEIGGIQMPEIRIPEDGKSFDIGKLTETDRTKINIKAPKPVYVHSRFQDESAIYDPLKIGDLLDQKLTQKSAEKDAAIVFVDDKSFSGAMMINGRYTSGETSIKAEITVVKDQQVIKQITAEAINEDRLTEIILTEILAK